MKFKAWKTVEFRSKQFLIWPYECDKIEPDIEKFKIEE